MKVEGAFIVVKLYIFCTAFMWLNCTLVYTALHCTTCIWLALIDDAVVFVNRIVLPSAASCFRVLDTAGEGRADDNKEIFY